MTLIILFINWVGVITLVFSSLLFNNLLKWLAPSLVFTCEEAWKAIGHTTSIHLEDFYVVDNNFNNELINKKWKIVREVRKVITGALEIKRLDPMLWLLPFLKSSKESELSWAAK